MIQFQWFEANFSAIAFPKPDVAPVINTILCIACEGNKQPAQEKWKVKNEENSWLPLIERFYKQNWLF